MGDSGSAPGIFPRGGMAERGNTSPGYEALRGALRRLSGSLPVGSPGSSSVTSKGWIVS